VGLARLYQGDFRGAEASLAEALRIYDPKRDRDARFRFGIDCGAGAAAQLTLAIWALGDVERARSLSEEALARADETGHAPTRASVYYYISLYQMLRSDPEAVRRAAKIPLELGREYGMALYLAWGEVLSNWACARLGDRDSGMTGLQKALAAYLGQGNKLHAPLFQGRLAEVEAQADDADGALRRIDEALVLADETAGHWTDALLHRIRGEIFLKPDPANPAPAEEAFQIAIAIAQAQKARSFELQAALALAKLYQSTGSPADAEAALAPPLKGFSPTAERQRSPRRTRCCGACRSASGCECAATGKTQQRACPQSPLCIGRLRSVRTLGTSVGVESGCSAAVAGARSDGSTARSDSDP
jgi:adenylate cyclase